MSKGEDKVSKNRKIFGVTGWKNAGKTTLTAALIKEFTARGYRVSSVKHAHHAFDVDQKCTDSDKHRSAGSGEVMLASSKRFALMHEYRKDEPELSLSELLTHMSSADLILVEGFKAEDIPKIELRRTESAQDPLTNRIPGIVAIATDETGLASGSKLPSFNMNAISEIADFITKYLLLEAPAHD